MKQVILDTSFIIACVKQKIDFFEDIKLMGLQVLIPVQVISELNALKEEVSLKLLEKNKFKKIDVENSNVDKGIINYAKKDAGLVVATLDKEIKTKVKNPKMVIRGKKKLEII